MAGDYGIRLTTRGSLRGCGRNGLGEVGSQSTTRGTWLGRGRVELGVDGSRPPHEALEVDADESGMARTEAKAP